MEQSKKVTHIKSLIVVLFLLATTISSWGQYKPDAEYRIIKLEQSAATYKKVGFWTMLSSPVVVYVTNKVRQYKVQSKGYYKVDIYSDNTYSSVLETLRFESSDEAWDYHEASSNSSIPHLEIEKVYPFPSWVPWAAGGATLAIGGIIYGVGAYKGYLFRKEKYKMEFSYNMTSLSMKLSF